MERKEIIVKTYEQLVRAVEILEAEDRKSTRLNSSHAT